VERRGNFFLFGSATLSGAIDAIRKKSAGIFYFLLLAPFILALFAAILSAWPFTTDDAYITLRYASNWANYGQLNWNLNDPTRVEGYSSSLYLALAFLAIKLSLNPVVFLKVVSLISLCGALAVIFLMARMFSNTMGGMMAATFLGSYYGTIWWTVSGLETATYIFLTLLSLYFYCLSLRTAEKKSLLLLGLTGVLVSLTAMTRPEGPLIGIVIVVGLLIESLVEKRPWKLVFIKVFYLALPFIVIYGTYFLLRYSWFNELWPNSYYCKKGFARNPWSLINMFLRDYKIYLLVGLIGFLNKKVRAFLAISYSYVFILMAGLYGVDPIIAHYNRHFLIAIALSAIILVVALDQLGRIKPLIAGVFILICIIYNIQTTFHHRERLKDEAASYAKRMEARARLAEYLNGLPILSYAIGDAGLVPYLTPGKKVFDYYGLNSREFTSKSIGKQNKLYANWLANQWPDAVIIVSNSEISFVSKNQTQILLYNLFTRDRGYGDLSLSFGASGSIYHSPYYYRILIRKGEESSY